MLCTISYLCYNSDIQTNNGVSMSNEQFFAPTQNEHEMMEAHYQQELEQEQLDKERANKKANQAKSTQKEKQTMTTKQDKAVQNEVPPHNQSASKVDGMTLFEKLSAIQCALVASKDQVNAQLNFSYRSAEGILQALKPYLEQYQCYVLLDDDILVIGDRFYVKSTAQIGDKSGQIIKASSMAQEIGFALNMTESQMTGMSSSYARKYALGGLFAIDNGDDPDKLNHGNNNQNNSFHNGNNNQHGHQGQNNQQANDQSNPNFNPADYKNVSFDDKNFNYMLTLYKQGKRGKNGVLVTQEVLLSCNLTPEQRNVVLNS